MKYFTLLIFCLWFSSFATADQYNYVPGMEVKLGGGISFQDVGTSGDGLANLSNSACILHSESNTPSGLSTVQIDLDYAFSTRALFEKLEVDTAAAAKIGFLEGNLDTKYKEIREKDSTSVYVYYTASAEWPQQTIDAPDPNNEQDSIRLSENGLKTLALAKSVNDPELFFTICGREYVSSMTKGARASLVYKFSAQNEYYHQKLKASVSANYKSSSGSINIDKVKTETGGNIQLRVISIIHGAGNDGLKITDITEMEAGNVTNAIARLNDAIDGFRTSYSSAPIVRFGTSTYNRQLPFLQAFPSQYKTVNIDNRIIDFYFDEYMSVVQSLENVRSLLDGGNEDIIDIEEARRLEASYVETLVDITKAANSCVSSGECEYRDATNYSIIPALGAGVGLWRLEGSGLCLPHHGMHERHAYGQVFANLRVPFPDGIRQVYVSRVSVQGAETVTDGNGFSDVRRESKVGLYTFHLVGEYVSGNENWDWGSHCANLVAKGTVAAKRWIAADPSIRVSVDFWDGTTVTNYFDSRGNRLDVPARARIFASNERIYFDAEFTELAGPID